MVSPVGISPIAFLNNIQGVSTPAPAPAGTSSGSGSATTSQTNTTTPASSASTTAQSLVSSLLGNSSGFGPEVLSLLQENNSGSFDPITSLLGGASTNDALTSVYANLYASVSAAALTQAQDNGTTLAAGATSASTQPNAAQNLINSQVQASIAYNQTLVQNAQSIASANDYGPDGVTPLVA